ncbi:hypothetical protein F1880_000163 [Penicillium rolfsii]|nr:hypothetical protein F1880_000163 [Penicillium rolfsii]
MFGTLRYLPEKKTGEFLERESGVAGNKATNKPQHSACDNCRVKKIRCSGRKAGCSRCKTLSLSCNYTQGPSRKGKKKQAPGSSKKDNENETCPVIGAAASRSPARDAAATAVMQPSLLTMEPHRVDENYIGPDKGMHQVQGDPGSVLDPMYKEVSTWSSCLDWSLEGEDTIVLDSDFPIAGNSPLVPADFFNTSYSGSESTAQQQPPPPLPFVSNSPTPPDLLPTPRLTHILAPTVSTIRSNEDTAEIAVGEQSSCSCVNSAIFLLDELESPHHEGGTDEQGLDAILSIYQKVIFLCKRMINSILCGEVIDAFIARREANGPEAPPIPVAMIEKQTLALGEYEIEGGDYEVMMGVLVTRRLLEMESFLARIKTIGSLTRRTHQQARMSRIDQHIKDFFRKLTSVCPFVAELRVDSHRPVAADPGRNISVTKYTTMDEN